MPKELTSPEIATKNIYDARAARYIQLWNQVAGEGLGLASPSKAKFLELFPAGRILDVGAGGTGRAANFFLAGGYDYLGVDISAGMIRQARKNCPRARFEQASIYDLDFAEPFDGFWCSAVLLHIPKDRLGPALSAIEKNLKSGAYGFISIKEGDGEVIEPDGRFCAYWRQEDFAGRLAKGGYRVVSHNRLSAAGIDWLDYVVRTE